MPCTVFIPLCKNNLNLPICFFLPCAWLPPLVHCVIILAPSLRCADFFLCFNWSRFCSPATNQIISLNQSNGWFPLILLCKREKYYWTGPLGLRINYTNMISELYQHMYSYTNIFFTEEWKQTLTIFYPVLLPARTINCENCQLCAINLSQLRTTYRLPTQTIIL